MTEATPTPTPTPSNPFRDLLPLRLCGYANEVGEAFRPLTSPLFVRATYGVALAYVCGDTAFSFNSEPVPDRRVRSAARTFLWQMIASVMVPGATINLTVKVASKGLSMVKASPPLARWGPVAIGLAAIPVIIHPIDKLADHLFETEQVNNALDAVFLSNKEKK